MFLRDCLCSQDVGLGLIWTGVVMFMAFVVHSFRKQVGGGGTDLENIQTME